MWTAGCSSFAPPEAEAHTVSLAPLSCFACQGLAVQPVRLHRHAEDECGRVACRRCVAAWIRVAGPARLCCPTCRQPVDPRLAEACEDALLARLLGDLPVRCGGCGATVLHGALRAHETPRACPALGLAHGGVEDADLVERFWRTQPDATREVVAAQWPDHLWERLGEDGDGRSCVPAELLLRVPDLVLPFCLVAWRGDRLPRILALTAREDGAALRVELDAWLARQPLPDLLRAVECLFGDPAIPLPPVGWLPRTGARLHAHATVDEADPPLLERGALRLAVQEQVRLLGAEPAAVAASKSAHWAHQLLRHAALSPADLVLMWHALPPTSASAAVLLGGYVARCQRAGQWPVPRSPPFLAEFTGAAAAAVAAAAGHTADEAARGRLVEALASLVRPPGGPAPGGAGPWLALPAAYALAERAVARIVAALLVCASWESQDALLARVVRPMVLGAVRSGVVPPLTPTMARRLVALERGRPAAGARLDARVVRSVLSGAPHFLDPSLYPARIWQATAWGLVALHGALGGRPEQLPHPLLFTAGNEGPDAPDVLEPVATARLLAESPRENGRVLLTLLCRRASPTTPASVRSAWCECLGPGHDLGLDDDRGGGGGNGGAAAAPSLFDEALLVYAAGPHAPGESVFLVNLLLRRALAGLGGGPARRAGERPAAPPPKRRRRAGVGGGLPGPLAADRASTVGLLLAHALRLLHTATLAPGAPPPPMATLILVRNILAVADTSAGDALDPCVLQSLRMMAAEPSLS